MRSINIANDKKRDAEVGFLGVARKPSYTYVLKDGTPKRNIKVLKGTLEVSEDILLAKYGDLNKLGEEIINGDPEIDIEKTGRLINKTKRLYLGKDNKIAFSVNLFEIVKNPDGIERERRELSKTDANILGEIPLQWTGKKIPKAAAIKKFVFSKNYQIKHVNGLTYDFLYDMAKQLQESNSMMFVGAGKKGNEPIILNTGGVPYRGFLEGRVKDEKYCLVLHLTNMELKVLQTNE